MEETIVFDKVEDQFPYDIVEYKTAKNKDALFYCLADFLVKCGYNTKPETLKYLSEDNGIVYEIHAILAAKLLLTYFSN